VLKLSGNEIDREAAEEIIQAVSNMQHLELLDLNCKLRYVLELLDLNCKLCYFLDLL